MKNNKLTPQETFMKSAFGGPLSPEERESLRRSLITPSGKDTLSGNEKMNAANKYSEQARYGLKLDSMGGTVPNEQQKAEPINWPDTGGPTSGLVPNKGLNHQLGEMGCSFSARLA